MKAAPGGLKSSPSPSPGGIKREAPETQRPSARWGARVRVRVGVTVEVRARVAPLVCTCGVQLVHLWRVTAAGKSACRVQGCEGQGAQEGRPYH